MPIVRDFSFINKIFLAEITCPTVPTYPNANIDQASTTDRSIGAQYSYTCSGSNRFIDGDTQAEITCDITGVWTGISDDGCAG